MASFDLEEPPKQNSSEIQWDQWFHKMWLYISDKAMPAGTILSFGGASAPDGYLLCDGTTVSRTKYAALFAAVGTKWGSGDGSTTFHLPDGRGVFLRGIDNMGTGAAGKDVDGTSRGVGSYQSDQLASHVHTVWYSVGATAGSSARSGPADGSGSTTGTGSAGGTETRPKNIGVLHIIKT